MYKRQIQTYIDYYLQAWTHYRERFEMLIEILYHEDTKPFFPTYIKRKGSDDGLLDYFFNGTSSFPSRSVRST